jgi:hypothetical protein
MPEKRNFRPRSRRSGFRDAKLIIIATEGMQTERIYFEDMASPRYYYNPRIHVNVLEPEGTASSPEHVLQRLRQFRKQYHLNRYDELWLVVDRDRWPEAMLATVSARCQQANYFMAVSNPCFELWLLLHLQSLNQYPDEFLHAFLVNLREGNRTRLESELVSLLGAYNKSHPDTSQFLPYVETAIQRARALDRHPEHRWPNDLGTRAYLLAERIMNRNPTIQP